MKYLIILLQAFLITALFIWPFAIMLRDGLGPDSEVSTGMLAVFKTFMTFYIGPITTILIMILLVLTRKVTFSLQAIVAFVFISGLFTALAVSTKGIMQELSITGLLIWVLSGLFALWKMPRPE